MSDGDGVLFDATLENSAAGELTVKVTADARDVINVDVRNNESLDDDGTEDLGSDDVRNNESLDDDGTEDLGSDDGRANRNAVQGDGTFVARLVMLILTALQNL